MYRYDEVSHNMHNMHFQLTQQLPEIFTLIFFYCMYVTEATCAGFTIPNSDVKTYITQKGVTVTEVYCHPGYKFPDETRYRSVVCVGDNLWSIHPTQLQCIGKLFAYNVNYAKWYPLHTQYT